MALNAAEVSVAVTGAISKVPASLDITSAEQALAGEGIINYGFVSSDGVTIASENSTTDITAWQNSSIVRTASTSASTTYTFTLLQNTREARELYYGAVEVGGKISYKPSAQTNGKFVIDYIDSNYAGGEEGEIMYGRHVIHRGQVTSRSDIVLQNGEAIGYQLTVSAYPDENGVCADIFHSVGSVDGVAAASVED